MVFAGRTTGAVELASWLRDRGFAAEGLGVESAKEQGASALERLNAGELEALVVTDAAARDLEGEPVACVVHYDAAADAAAWIARDEHVEEDGEVVVLRTPRERMLIGSVERELGLDVSLRPVPRGQAVGEQNMVRLFISAGRRDGVRPGDVVGAISNEADVPGRAIGSIDIYDRFTFVDVEDSFAEQVRDRMGGKTLRGRTVDVRPATPRGQEEEEFERAGADQRGGRAPQAGGRESQGGGRSQQGGGREKAPRSRQAPREDMSVLVVELGYRDGVRPGELVAAIAGEAEISGKDIGSIDISDELTFVEVPEDLRDEVVERMDGALIRGREATFRLPSENELSGDLEQARAPRRDRAAPAPEPGMSRLFISAGHNLGVRPADIVGAIANDAGIPGREIGTIDIYDRYSFVEIPAEHQPQVLERMSRAMLRGRSVEFRKATPRGQGADADAEHEPAEDAAW